MSWVRWLWDGYEALFARLMRLRPLGPGSMLRVRSMKYAGRPLRAGEQALLPGMRVLDLHLDNRRIGGLGSTGTEVAFRLRERIRRELPLLWQAVREAPEPVAGVVGISLLAFGARRLGFHVEPLPPGLGRWWLAMYLTWLARVYRLPGRAGHPSGERRRRAQVFVAWMTAAELERLAQR